jgi:DNA-binding CsgD family transcriptional regulator
MRSESTLLELVGLAYDAASDAAQWTPFLKRLGQVLHTPMSALYVRDTSDRHRSLTAEVGFDPAFVSSYNDYYANRNAFMIHGKEHLWDGNVCTNDVLCPDRILFRTEFYNDWLVPQKAYRAIDAVIAKHETLMSILVLIRGNNAKVPDRDDISFVQTLVPHLRRAVQVHGKLADLRLLQQATKDALDRWSMGIVLLDKHGRVILLNQAAESIARQGEGLFLESGELRTKLTSETTKLRKLIRGAISTATRQVAEPGGAMMISRQAPRRPLSVLVAPLSGQQSIVPLIEAACAIFVADPDANLQTDTDILRELYGLTAAESKVTALLVQGNDIRRIADELQVGLNTARTHLKRVFEKTHTRRQAELVQMILRAPTATRLRGPNGS